jgi:uracil-DNA glycosylase
MRLLGCIINGYVENKNMITYHEIAECRECNLRQLFTEEYKGSNKYHSFTFYYDPQKVEKSKYIIVMQNPGLPKNWSNLKEYQMLSQTKHDNFISISREYLIQWFRNENTNFHEKFFNVLKEYGLVQFNNLDNYLKNNFLSDFIVTDLVKCRAKTEKIKSENITVCSNRFLFNEIHHYGKNKLVFAFSSRAWESLYSKFIEDQNNDDRRVSNSHGKLFPVINTNLYFIPLAHFSQRQYNNYLRESYFDYLKEGLEQYRKLFPHNNALQ